MFDHNIFSYKIIYLVKRKSGYYLSSYPLLYDIIYSDDPIEYHEKLFDTLIVNGYLDMGKLLENIKKHLIFFSSKLLLKAYEELVSSIYDEIPLVSPKFEII